MSFIPSEDPLTVLDQARRGDREAVGRLLQTYIPYLKLLARLELNPRLQSRLDASDIVQETVLAAQRDLPHFRGETEKELVGWLRIILANTAAAAVRHHTRQRRDVGLEKQFQQGLDGSAVRIGDAMAGRDSSPSQRSHRRERSVLLSQALAQLPDDYREVLILRELEGLTFSEVARRMERSDSSVKNIWVRGMMKMRTLMGRYEL
jgi:RNA polymerase sigma-70 factor (ECF subfamily)